MGSLIPPELTLDCSLSSKSWIPITTGKFFSEVSRIEDVSDKILKLNDYVTRLQDEMKKIDAFKRELPLCMLLLNDAIATMKEEIMQCRSSNFKPVLEEFIPLKKNSTDEKDEKIEVAKDEEIISSRDKMNWMSSVQLWNSDSNKKRKEVVIRPKTDNLFQSTKNKAAFSPFKICDNFPVIGKAGGDVFAGAPSLSLRTPEIKNLEEEIYCRGFRSKSSSSRSGSSSATNSQSDFKAEQQQIGRKQRRCWSPELHRRFLNALQQLGGALVATPKQIRELMQVDGLTNDEVKSHLQKYRLHIRRVSSKKESSPSVSGESSKPSNSQSGSPQGPLHNLAGSSRGTSTTGGDSLEDEDDERSVSHSWRSHKRSSKGRV